MQKSWTIFVENVHFWLELVPLQLCSVL